MKKHLLYLLLTPLVFLYSCSGDDVEIPALDPQFQTDPEFVEVALPVMFDNLTTNANSYSWDFGDGNTSTEVSPTHTFEEPGTYEVTLTATAVDGQEVVYTENVSVLQRVLTAYLISALPLDNDGTPWDPDAPTDSSYADVIIQLAPVDPSNPDFLTDGIYIDVTGTPIGNQVNAGSFGEGIELTNEEWVVVLADFDGDFENINIEESEVMFGVRFNPLSNNVTTTWTGDGRTGFITLFAPVNDNQFLDVDFFFELQ